MSPNALECMEVFLVAYTCLNLNSEIFAEGPVSIIIQNTITNQL
jgi:hypothetical protein